LLKLLSFDLALNPLFLIHAVSRSVFFFSRLSALAKPYSLASFGVALAGATWQCVWF